MLTLGHTQTTFSTFIFGDCWKEYGDCWKSLHKALSAMDRGIELHDPPLYWQAKEREKKPKKNKKRKRKH